MDNSTLSKINFANYHLRCSKEDIRRHRDTLECIQNILNHDKEKNDKLDEAIDSLNESFALLSKCINRLNEI